MATVLERDEAKVEGKAIRPISADSHVTEPPNAYIDYIDPKYRDRAPRVRRDPERGDFYDIDGLRGGIGLGTFAAAGKTPSEVKKDGTFEGLHRSGWDPKLRLADQDLDGVYAEVIYPSVGMVLCGHEDVEYKHACMMAYNRWIADYASVAPERLLVSGQTAMRDVAESIKDLEDCKAAGMKTVMLPLYPCTEFDYDDPRWDPFWQASVDLDIPPSFHISAGGNKKDKAGNFIAGRGPSLGVWIGVIRSVQDIAGMLIFSGVFDRVPGLKIAMVEGDAGWLPHMMYRMDHAYNHHRFWMKGKELQKMPSDYWLDHFKLTFQDDKTAWQAVGAGLLDARLLMWANDFPHTDATWPKSMAVLTDHTKGVTFEDRKMVLEQNVTDFYKIKLPA
ncbi:amidohydrolase family protein [Rhizorhabdus wittichii]|uniref:amidohydrolase family protein n=1 Tax=Rhizorhabdus wittichii TaxID=160791 RepID=UPI0003201006|nr:amidohydrolase family protein [Rhizorhabdus wittichii]